MTLKLGELVTLGGANYVVATITGFPPNSWQLVRVPDGAAPLELGKSWRRTDPGVETLTLFAAPQAPPSATLEDATPKAPASATLEDAATKAPRKG